MPNLGPAVTITNHPQVWNINQSLRLLASLKDMNFSQIQETKVQIIDSAKWYPLYMVLSNASVNFTAIGAAISIYTGPNATGNHIFGGTPLATHTNSRIVNQINVNSGTRANTATDIFIRSDNNTGIPNATLDVFIYGFDLGFLP